MKNLQEVSLTYNRNVMYTFVSNPWNGTVWLSLNNFYESLEKEEWGQERENNDAFYAEWQSVLRWTVT